MWLRHEAVHNVDWGGDPHNKAIATREGDDVRLSPRKSFAPWRETVRGRSEPWTEREVRSAEELRARLLEVLLERTQLQVRAAETMQRSLLPSSVPDPEGWSVHARYEPAAGGRVGGDWYDALVLPDGRLAVVVGDVAGHGLSAAAAMGQVRNALRAYLLRGDSPAQTLASLDHVVRWTMPFEMATVVVALVDLATGEVELSVAGHPRPLLLEPGGSATLLEIPVDRPVGVWARASRRRPGSPCRPVVGSCCTATGSSTPGRRRCATGCDACARSSTGVRWTSTRSCASAGTPRPSTTSRCCWCAGTAPEGYGDGRSGPHTDRPPSYARAGGGDPARASVTSPSSG